MLFHVQQQRNTIFVLVEIYVRMMR